MYEDVLMRSIEQVLDECQFAIHIVHQTTTNHGKRITYFVGDEYVLRAHVEGQPPRNVLEIVTYERLSPKVYVEPAPYHHSPEQVPDSAEYALYVLSEI